MSEEAVGGAAQGAAAGSVFGPIGMAAGALLGAIGGIGASKARKRAAKRRAAIQRAQAAEHRRTTRLKVDAFKKQSKISMGENISSFAKAGVDISGSPLMVLAQNDKEASNQAAEMTRAGNEQARLLEAGAQVSLSEGRAEGRAGTIAAVGTLLGGVGRAMGR